jgi:Protein of unknown function (DUF4239)
MSPLMVSGIIFACIFGGALLGMLLRGKLSVEHLCSESKDVIKLGMGLVGTMTALVLGLLIASAKSSYDMQRNGVAQLSANVITLDRTLARYGEEAREARELLRTSLADLIQRTWPEESAETRTEARSDTEGRYEAIYDRIEGLTPKNENQRALQAQALKIAQDTGQTRWLLFAHKGNSIPTPFLAVMVCWLTLILTSFGLLAPRKVAAVATLMVCALAVSSAIFLILELDHPLDGVIKIPSLPLRNALAQLGR